MTRDFAKKRHYKKKQKMTFNRIALILFLVVIMIFLGGGAFYYYHVFHKKLSMVNKTDKYEHQATVTKIEKIEVKPRFEFYNMLSNQKGENRNLNAVQTKVKLANNVVANEEKGIYILQIAAFRQMGDAKLLMAEIAKKGFKIGLKKDSEQMWIRVQVGPYLSKILAEQAQRSLKELNYNSILIKIG